MIPVVPLFSDPVENKGNYLEALVYFQQAEFYEKSPLKALAGQLYCHVALGQWDEIKPTIILIHQTIEELTNCEPSKDRPPLSSEEQHAAYLCRRRTREIANEMRQRVEALVRETVPGIFKKIKTLRELYPYIDALERTAIGCCQSNVPWKCCLDPLLEQLEVWNNLGLETF